jgi:hypothetical protein
MTQPTAGRPWRWIMLAALLALLPGCPPIPQGQKQEHLAGSGMEMFAPVSIRVHPLSRVVSDKSACMLQARLEFSDQMGDVGKGVGTVDLQLFEYHAIVPGHRGRALGSFSISLQKPDANRAHWDAITRTYLFELPIAYVPTADGNTRFVLNAVFRLPNGTKLKDEAVIGGK